MDLFNDMSNAIKLLQLQCLEEFGLAISSTNGKEALKALLRCLDTLFMHGLRNKHFGYWCAMKQFSPKDVIEKIERYYGLHEITKSHVWLQISLNENLLEFVLLSVQRNFSLLDVHYYKSALLHSTQVQLIQGILCGLEFVHFNLNVRDVRWFNPPTQYSTAIQNQARKDSEIGSSVYLNTEILTKSGKKVAKSLQNLVQGAISSEKNQSKVQTVEIAKQNDLTSTCSSYSNLASGSLIDFDEEIILPDTTTDERHNPFDTDTTVYDDPWEGVMMNCVAPIVTRHNLDVLVVDTPIEVIRKRRRSSKRRLASRTSFTDLEEYQPLALPKGSYELEETDSNNRSSATNSNASTLENNFCSGKTDESRSTSSDISPHHSIVPLQSSSSKLPDSMLEWKEFTSFDVKGSFPNDAILKSNNNLVHVENIAASPSLRHGSNNNLLSEVEFFGSSKQPCYPSTDSLVDDLSSLKFSVYETENVEEKQFIQNTSDIENATLPLDSYPNLGLSECNKVSNNVCNEGFEPDAASHLAIPVSKSTVLSVDSVACEVLTDTSSTNNLHEMQILSRSTSLDDRYSDHSEDSLQKLVVLNDSSTLCNCKSQFPIKPCYYPGKIDCNTSEVSDEFSHKPVLNIQPCLCSNEDVMSSEIYTSACSITNEDVNLNDSTHIDDVRELLVKNEPDCEVFSETDNANEIYEADSVSSQQSLCLEQHEQEVVSPHPMNEAPPSVAASSPNFPVDNNINISTSSNPSLSQVESVSSQSNIRTLHKRAHIDNNLLLHLMLNVLHCEDEKVLQLVEVPFQKASLLFSDMYIYLIHMMDGAFARAASVSYKQPTVKVLHEDQGLVFSSLVSEHPMELYCYTSDSILTQQLIDAFLECSSALQHKSADELIDRGSHIAELHRVAGEHGVMNNEITNYCLVKWSVLDADSHSGILQVKTGKIFCRWVKHYCVFENGVFYQYLNKNSIKPVRCLMLHNCTAVTRKENCVTVTEDDRIVLELRAVIGKDVTQWFKVLNCLVSKTNLPSFGSFFISAGCLYVALQSTTVAVSLLDVVSVLKCTDKLYCDVTVKRCNSVVTDMWRFVFADSRSCENFYRVFNNLQVHMQSE